LPEALPVRTVEHVQQVLKRDGDSPTLLGGAQVLVDGGRVVFERPGPAPDLIRGLWTLLPTQTRGQLWPATFAFSNRLGFHALVVPKARGVEYSGYVNEEQAGSYPEGRYELNLQIAAEAGDQKELDILFARRGRAETWRFALFLLFFIAVLLFVLNLVSPTPPAAAPDKLKSKPKVGRE
jgi:hypothetical protein